MDVDKELREILEKGIEIKEKFPYRFYKGRLYYHIFVRIPKKNCFVLVLERKNIDSTEEQIKLRLIQILEVINYERNPIQSSLTYARTVLNPYKNIRFRNPNEYKYNLNGILHLPTESETR